MNAGKPHRIREGSYFGKDKRKIYGGWEKIEKTLILCGKTIIMKTKNDGKTLDK